MIIGTPCGKLLELTVLGPDMYRVNLDRRTHRENPFWMYENGTINTGTLTWLLNQWGTPDTRSPHQREADIRRCRQGYSWQCPHFPEAPCLHPERAASRKHLVVILVSFYKEVSLPIGQMDLFRPTVTHRRCWKHVKSGRLAGNVPRYLQKKGRRKNKVRREDVLPDPRRPFRPYLVVCEDRALASLESEKHHGFAADSAQAWKILKYQAEDDPAWGDRMAKDHEGRYRACVFSADL